MPDAGPSHRRPVNDNDDNAKTPSTTFVCCVESGPLERQTLLMIDTLRRFGGRFADAPVVAVRPRLGPPLERATRRAFDRLHVEYLDISRQKRRYAWLHFLNKPCCLAAVEERADTDCVGFLDGDVLVLREPAELALDGETDLRAAAVEPAGTTIASAGPGDENDVHWSRLAAAAGLKLDDIPLIVPDAEPATPVRFYLNSGVYAYRRSTQLGRRMLDVGLRVLDAGVVHRDSGPTFTEQAALGLATLRHDLRWRPLPASHNFFVAAFAPERLELLAERRPAVVHYHDATRPDFRPRFVRALRQVNPEAAEMVESANLDAPFGRPSTLARKALRAWRATRRTAYARRHAPA